MKCKLHIVTEVCALALIGAVTLAAAQQAAPQDPNPRVRDLGLSAAQKNAAQKNAVYRLLPKVKAAVPDGFRADLEKLPKAVSDLIPQAENYEYVVFANQVLIVDPKTKQVVDVIAD